MQPYWDRQITAPLPSFGIKEIEQRQDNLYVRDEWDRVWQIWFEVDGPIVRMVDRA